MLKSYWVQKESITLDNVVDDDSTVEEKQLVIATGNTAEVVQLFHDRPVGAHIGMEKTLEK